MLKYQIHKLSKGAKEARAVLLEDILTSDVFGLMSYLPYELLFRPFLDQIKVQNPESDFSVPDSGPLAMHFWKTYVWPDDFQKLNRGSIEPDVVVEWSDTLMIVEAKFVSATDPEELLREYIIGQFQAGNNKKAYLLLIDKNLSQPQVNQSSNSQGITVSKYLKNRIQELQFADRFPPENVPASILWINWQNFYAQVEALKKDVLSGVNGSFGSTSRKILDDLLAVLKRKGLEAFEKLDLTEFYKYRVNLDYLGQIGRMMNDPVPFLSQFNLLNEAIEDLLHIKN